MEDTDTYIGEFDRRTFFRECIVQEIKMEKNKIQLIRMNRNGKYVIVDNGCYLPSEEYKIISKPDIDLAYDSKWQAEYYLSKLETHALIRTPGEGRLVISKLFSDANGNENTVVEYPYYCKALDRDSTCRCFASSVEVLWYGTKKECKGKKEKHNLEPLIGITSNVGD